MMRFKPLLITTLFSVLLFFVIVILGVKYRWVNELKQTMPDQVALVLAQHKVDDPLERNNESVGVNSEPAVAEQNDNKNTIPPVDKTRKALFEVVRNSGPFDSMTKAQVRQYCERHLQGSSLDAKQSGLAIGLCVLSNYREEFILIDKVGEVNETGDIQRVSVSPESLVDNLILNPERDLFGNQQENNRLKQALSVKNRVNRQAQTRRTVIRQQCESGIVRQAGLSDREQQLLIQLCIEDQGSND